MFSGLHHGLAKFNSITTPELWAIASKVSFPTLLLALQVLPVPSANNSQSTIAATILCLLCLALAKCSVLALILRVIGPKAGWNRPVCIGLMCLSIAWGVGSSITFLAKCRADSILTIHNTIQCPSQVCLQLPTPSTCTLLTKFQNSRWLVITIIDIITETLSWALVVQLTTVVGIKYNYKFQVILAFSFRLPLIVLSILHLIYFWDYPTSDEPQFQITNSLLFLQSMLVYSLISATIPNLKNFLKSLSMGMGVPLDSSIYDNSTNSYPLRRLENSRSMAVMSTIGGTGGASTTISANDPSELERDGEGGIWRREEAMNHDRSEEEEISRAGSQEMIINKKLSWKVTYETQ